MDAKTVTSIIVSSMLTAGAASAVTYILTKKTITARCDAELEDMKQHYQNKLEEAKKACDGEDKKGKVYPWSGEKLDEKVDDSEFDTMADILKDAGYTAEEPKKKAAPKKKKKASTPVLITPEEFLELNGYSKETLSYFTDDGQFADADYVLKDDIFSILGADCTTHFGELGDDPNIAYFRDDARKTDYELIMEETSYAKFMSE